MAVLIILVGFFLFNGSDSLAQVYKAVDKKGTVCFSDTPPPSNSEESDSNEAQKAKEVSYQQNASRSEIKDILQMGHEILKEELAKPPEKQNRRLIQEMTEILYGDVSGKKSKSAF